MMLILLWELVKMKSLEDEIAVTVVATGFAPDQQCEITDTEVKRIIHHFRRRAKSDL